MRYVRFYQEFTDRRRKTASGNVLAVLHGNGFYPDSEGRPTYEAVVALYDYPNSPVVSGSVRMQYLRTRCKRITEAEARLIHPQLFVVVDKMKDFAVTVYFDQVAHAVGDWPMRKLAALRKRFPQAEIHMEPYFLDHIIIDNLFGAAEQRIRDCVQRILGEP